VGTVRSAKALAIALAVAVAASCSSPSDAHDDRAAGANRGELSAYPTASVQRVLQAIGYARQLADDGPHVAGETALTTVPSKLRHPGQVIGVDNLITRHLYWSVAATPQHLYATLKRAPAADLRLSGWGGPGSAGGPANSAELFYTRADTPSYLNEAELDVQLLGVAPGRTDVAAFAEVVPYPVRRMTDTIPVDAGTAVLTRTASQGQNLPPVRQVTLTSTRARQLITALNGSKIRPPGMCVGGLPPAFGYAVSITSRTGSWQITWTGADNCDSLSVQRDGTDLYQLQASSSLLHLLETELAGPDGIIDAVLWRVRGDSLVSLDGTITLATMQGHVVARTAVSGQRAYEFIVPPGQYRLTATSPHFEGGAVTCTAQHPPVVRQDHTTMADVRCQH
jgi:hypothetical protein